jgi:hypothetical protein
LIGGGFDFADDVIADFPIAGRFDNLDEVLVVSKTKRNDFMAEISLDKLRAPYFRGRNPIEGWSSGYQLAKRYFPSARFR